MGDGLTLRRQRFNLLSGDSHLFVELWRLGQVCRAFEVGDLKDVGSTLASCGDDLGSVNLHEALLAQIVTKQFANASLRKESLKRKF